MLNTKKIALLTMLLVVPTVAMSAPIIMTHETEITSADANPFGVNIGDAVTLSVVVDNGSVGFVSQSWDVADIVSAQWTSGGYSALWDSATTWFNSSNPQFTTDALGNVTAALFQGANSSNGVDNAGNTAYLYQNGARTSENQNLLTPDNSHNIPANWQASEATSVSAPSIFALFGLALLGLGRIKRKAN